jgi:hypothetical protein
MSAQEPHQYTAEEILAMSMEEYAGKRKELLEEAARRQELLCKQRRSWLQRIFGRWLEE